MFKKIAIALFDFFSSVKLAVILLISLAIMLAIGTFYEAEYGTPDAQRVIYKSWFMSLEMILLIINLACAAVDRIPWKKHHIGFVVTHAGIITLLMGSFITQQRGIDGNLALGLNESSDHFSVSDTEFHVYQNFDGRPFALLFQKPIDLDSKPPTKNKYEFKLVDDDVLVIKDYLQKALRKLDVVPTADVKAFPAIKFNLANERVQVNEWLGLGSQAIPPFYDLGPAVVSFIRGNLPSQPQGRNQILVYQDPKDMKLYYAVFSMRTPKPTSKGLIEVGKEYATGWMNLKFKVEKFISHAVPTVDYQEGDQGATETVQALKASIGNKTSWFELENPHELKGDKSTYFVSFTRKRFDLGFQLFLKKFRMKTYGGSQLPMSYESTVAVNGKDETVISMNEPLKFNAYTIYQSSYETNERGEPIVSVFSINYDPGRTIKYTGALGIVLGIGIMFYLKPRWSRKKKGVT